MRHPVWLINLLKNSQASSVSPLGFEGGSKDLKKKKAIRQHDSMTSASAEASFPLCFYIILGTCKDYGQC
jgi:hypothetical protein